MNRQIRVLTIVLILAAPLFAVLSCKDNITDSDSTPPELPETIQVIQEFKPFPALSGREIIPDDKTNFHSANQQVEILRSLLFDFVIQASFNFDQGREVKPYLEEGVWIWEYDYSFASLNRSVKVSAEVMPNQTSWEMLETFTQPGEVVHDHKRLEGFTEPDSTTGEWVFFQYIDGEDDPSMRVEWEIQDNSNFSYNASLANIEKHSSATFYTDFEYVKNSPENTLTLNIFDSTSDIIYWNEETEAGYYILGSEPKICWDENRKNILCSE